MTLKYLLNTYSNVADFIDDFLDQIYENIFRFFLGRYFVGEIEILSLSRRILATEFWIKVFRWLL